MTGYTIEPWQGPHFAVRLIATGAAMLAAGLAFLLVWSLL